MTESSPAVAAVILAAGASTRLGEPKQLIEHEGVTLVRRAVLAAARAGAAPVIVVLGANSQRVSDAVHDIDDVIVVDNPSWQSGIASSLAAGLSAVADSDGALITLCDQPLVNEDSLTALIGAFARGSRIVASQYAGAIGVPVVIGREHFAELMRLEGDRGAAHWLRKAEGVTMIPLPAAILDIDTKEDAARLRALDQLITETR